MYPHRFNPSHARPHRDRSPRPWTSHCDSWDRKDSHRERERPVHHKYSTEGNSRRRDYSTSPKRPYRKDSSDADRSRRSPMRRRDSFEGDGSRHSLNHGSESGESDYRSRHVSEGKKRRWLSDRSDVCGTQDLEEFQGKDLSHKKRSPDYRPRHHHREVNDHHSRDGDSQASSTRNKGREGHKSGYCSSQQKLSEDHSSKYYESDVAQKQAAVCQQSTSAKGFQRFLDLLNKGVDVDMLKKVSDKNGHKSGHCSSELKPSEGQSRKYYESDVAQNQAAVCQPSTSAKGFQRFLDLLNKGVDVDMLNKIVAQTPSDPERHSTPDMDGQRDKTQQLGSDSPPGWQGGQRSQNRERSSHLGHACSRSPSPEKAALAHVDEHNCKQMQDVLQAIGLNLGFEELGQMSHRIQERLYGKKESEGRGSEEKTKERNLRKVRVPPPRSHSRLSSSSRSLSPPDRHTERYFQSSEVASPGDRHPEDRHPEDQHHGDQNPVDQHLEDQYLGDQHRRDRRPGDRYPGGQYSGDQCLADQHTVDQYQGDWHPLNKHPATANYQVSFPPPALSANPAVNSAAYPQANPPTYPQVNPPVNPSAYYPLMPCRPPFPPVPHIPPISATFLPPRPPVLQPSLPLLNKFPPQVAHMSHCPPQYAVGPPPPWIPPLVQAMDKNQYQKAKTPSRPRCLQVIETKQAG